MLRRCCAWTSFNFLVSFVTFIHCPGSTTPSDTKVALSQDEYLQPKIPDTVYCEINEMQMIGLSALPWTNGHSCIFRSDVFKLEFYRTKPNKIENILKNYWFLNLILPYIYGKISQLIMHGFHCTNIYPSCSKHCELSASFQSLSLSSFWRTFRYFHL